VESLSVSVRASRYPTPESLGPLVRAVAPGHHRGGAGSHGLTHWARVLENGLRLAPATGANVTVVALFAVFHDARRLNDGRDPGHGERVRPDWPCTPAAREHGILVWAAQRSLARFEPGFVAGWRG
jgi:hypothetical protein